MAIIEIDGDLFDDETGEYAGPTGRDLPSVLESEEDLLKYMRLLLDAETRATAEEMKYKSVLDNINKMVKRHKSKVNYLRAMYEGQAAKVATTLLPRDKDGNLRTKTYRCPFGTIGQRTTQPSLKVSDMTRAIEFMQESAPQAIKVEQKVLVSAIPDEVKHKLLNSVDIAEQFGFEVNPGGESVTIKTITETKDEAK
jgi:phage host-nuclease inhibitor protein Gam